MIYIKYITGILLIFFFTSSFSQNETLFVKHFTKEDKVIIRWVPSSKQVFKLGKENGYKISRQETRSAQTNVVLNERTNLIPQSDTSTWNKLYKQNENAVLINKLIYPDNENSNNADKIALGNMAYSLLLLSCDLDSTLAKATGLYFIDSSIKRNTEYQYTIEINKPIPSSGNFSNTITVTTNILSTNPEIKNLDIQIKNKNSKLSLSTINYTAYYGGYNIERSEDNITFANINKNPIVLLSSQFEKNNKLINYTDTLPKSGITYYYRIKGINVFGEESAPSNIVSCVGYEELSSCPFIDSAMTLNNKNIFLHWKMQNEKANLTPQKYLLSRSEKDAGPYNVIYETTNQFSFTDSAPTNTNYYKISAIGFGKDTATSYSRLVILIDSIPPLAPTGLQATVDTTGIVNLSWERNKENDIQGYKIYRCNSLNEEFIQINNAFITLPKFIDSLKLNTLSKKVYYAVVATDLNYNNSELSPPVQIVRPDTIPPIPAIINKLKTLQEGITISWIPSNSDDILSTKLYQISENTKQEKEIASFNQTDTLHYFFDTLTELGIGYRYKIITEDLSRNTSTSNMPYLFYETGFRNKIKEIKFNVDRSNKFINLLWEYPFENIEKYIIYRGQPNTPLTIIKTINASESEYIDKDLNIGNTYEYRIKVVYFNGAESIISDAVIVNY